MNVIQGHRDTNACIIFSKLLVFLSKQ